MKLELFSEYKTGQLIPVDFHGRDEHAFMPSILPPPHVSNDAFWPLLMEARTKLTRLDAIGSQLPEVRLLLRPLQRREALTSNSLEGTFVTPRELLLFEVRKQAARGDERREDDWREVMAYDVTLRLACRWIRDGANIDRELIKRLHFVLLDRSARGRQKSPGDFRTTQVVVGADRRYIPPPASELASLLENLESYLRSPPTGLDPLVSAYVAHYQFEAIHPFQDGNGRIGRLVLSLCVYKWLELKTPCLYMSEFFERNRKDYISHLFRISTHGEWNDWIEFCLHGTIEQATASLARCEALQALKKRYQEALSSDGRATLLLDGLFCSPFITVPDAQKKLRVTYPTAKACLERLVAASVLVEMQNQHPRTFVAHEIFNAAYGD